MADLNTRTKRFAGLQVGMPVLKFLPFPSGTWGRLERYHLLKLFAQVFVEQDVVQVFSIGRKPEFAKDERPAFFVSDRPAARV
jgi:hypothetical protein